MRAGGGQVMRRARQCRRGPQQSAAWVGENLHVDAVALVLAGVVGPVLGDPVDADEGAVQDQIPPLGSVPDDLREVGGLGGEQVGRLGDVPVDGRDPDAEPGGQPGIGVTVAQVSQDQQRLLAGVQAPPAAADLLVVAAQQLGQVHQAAGGQRDAGRMGQQRSSSGGERLILVDLFVYQELRPMWTTDTPLPLMTPHQVGNGSLPSPAIATASASGSPLCQAASKFGVLGWSSAGPGCDCSAVLTLGVWSAAPDCRVAPMCPPGPVSACWISRSICR